MNRKVNFIFLFIFSILWVRLGVGPAYISPDGTGYFSYLYSLLVDRDLDFENEYRDMKWPLPYASTPTGYISNIWPIGSAWILYPMGLLGQASRRIFGLGIEHGLLEWVLIFFNMGSTLFGIAAVWLCYLGLTDSGLTSPISCFLALAVFMGTQHFFYTFSVPSSTHAVSAFMVSFFLLHWTRTYRQGSQSLLRWFFMGLLLGSAGTVRSENLLFMIAPLCEWFDLQRRADPRGLSTLKFLGVYALGIVLGFSPQLYCWKILYGRFLYSPQVFNLSPSNFALYDVLFSPFHGLLPWTPIFLAGFLGLILTSRLSLTNLALFLTVLAQLLLASFAVAWWGGYSFGIRVLTNCLFPIALGLGFIIRGIKDTSQSGARYFLAILTGMALWTFSLCLQAMISWIDLGGFVFSWGTILTWQGRFLQACDAAVTRFIQNRYLSNLEFLVALCSVWGAVGLAWALQRYFKRYWALTSSVSLTVWFILFNIKLFEAQRNGPRIRIQTGVAQEDLSKVFLLQALYGRWYYELNRNDFAGARKTIERQLRIDPQSMEARKALQYATMRQEE